MHGDLWIWQNLLRGKICQEATLAGGDIVGGELYLEGASLLFSSLIF